MAPKTSSDYTFTTDRSVETVSRIPTRRRTNVQTKRVCETRVLGRRDYNGFHAVCAISRQVGTVTKTPPPCNACDRTEPDGVRYS